MKRPQIILFLFVCFITANCFSQSGYQKDSLQIKVYTEIEYLESQVKDIEVIKVFCDYCSEFQTEMLSQEALRRTYLEKDNEKIRLVNGKYKHAIYIRISKKDFSELKEEQIIDSTDN